jgi:hypothetical protein
MNVPAHVTGGQVDAFNTYLRWATKRLASSVLSSYPGTLSAFF